MQIAFLILMFILGACLGSFLCCQARRLHIRETTQNKKSLGARSVCLHCKRQLKWYDNIPIISWLFLKGKCRKCHHKIGSAEILSEFFGGVTAALIGYSALTSLSAAAPVIFPLNWIVLILTVIFTLILFFLAVYDGLYGQLPTAFLILAIVIAVVTLVLKEWSALTTTTFAPELIWQPLLSVLILGGLYLMLYFISKGKWVGDGDWLLGTAIALVLFDPWLSLVALFLANVLACFVMAPFVIKRKNSKIYFGPFLVAAFVIVYTFTDFIQSVL